MPEPDALGLGRLDVDRAQSMEDEGGPSAALVEWASARPGWRIGAAGVACLVGLAAGACLIRLWRSR